ncbi:MAG: methyltransferase [Deltaproteobacteria bacterium]|nr:methyltransferase [Deltaproteobacteria bacterium]
MGLDPHSRSRLTHRTAARFTGETLFDRLARAVCRAECLPRKELYESWELARRVRRHFRGGRVIDLAAGHALLAHVLLLLDDTSPSAVAIDARAPASAPKLAAVLTEEWPRLAGRVSFLEASITEPLPISIAAGDLVVSAHACGALTDRVLELAVAGHARVAVLPCCQDAATSDSGGLSGWLDDALSIDVTRALRVSSQGYEIRTLEIPRAITEKNRVLLAAPRAGLISTISPISGAP